MWRLQVLEGALSKGPVVVFIRDAGLLAEASGSAAAFKAHLGRLVGPVVFIGSHTAEPEAQVPAKDVVRPSGVDGIVNC